MADIAQRGNRLTKGINYDKAYVKSRSLVKDVYDAVAPKHSLGIKKKPHSSKEGVTASLGRTVRDVGKILSPERVKKFGGGRTNLLEQLGRVEAEPSNPNRRAEISRVHGELNKGYATGGRVGLKKGGKPWGTGPKPGTHEFMVQNLHKRKGKAIGGVAKLGKILAKKFKKKKVYPETEDLTHQVGPYVGDVGSEGKRRKLGPRGRGKSPGRPQAPGPKGTPAPKFGPGKPRDPRTPKQYSPGPRDPRKPKGWQAVAEGEKRKGKK